MKSCVISVGIGQWEEYTKPLIESVGKHEPDCTYIHVENGGHSTGSFPSTRPASLFLQLVHAYNDSDFIHRPVCYAEAINSGLDYAYNTFSIEPDWFVIINNDVLCTGAFGSYLETLDENTIYGNKLHTKSNKVEMPTPWIDGWIYAIPNKIVKAVGLFDKNFKIAGFEDADYCIRAVNAGFKVGKSELPFVHLEEHIRFTMDDYKQYRLDNITYLAEKHDLRLL